MALAPAMAGVTEIPASAALPLGSASTRGFLVRSVQGPENPPLANSLKRAVAQLNGTLTDATGALVANEAVAPTGTAWQTDFVNFQKDGNPFDVLDADQNVLASFTPDYFPGIPGVNGHTSNFAVEAVAYLELQPGTYTFGVNVSADRTDVNDDDSYVVYVSSNPRDYFGTKVGEYARSANAAAFKGDQHNENTWDVKVTVPGIYPFRIVYWQTGRGANLQFYTVDPNNGNRALVNDPNDPTVPVAYTTDSEVIANAASIVDVSPVPGSDGNSPAAPIDVLVQDGSSPVSASGVALYVNNVKVAPQSVTKNGAILAVHYDPNATRGGTSTSVRLEYKDAAGFTRTNSWTYGIVATTGSSTTVAAQWDFDNGDLGATVGKALQYYNGKTGTDRFGQPYDYVYGTTTALGIPDINGVPAKVIAVPGNVDRNIGLIADHGIKPNGGGQKVNQYTVIFDILVGTSGPGAASLLQIDTPTFPNNTSDGDLFWQGNNFGQGGGGYNGTGAFTAGAWHRVVAAYDEAATPPVVVKYVDGIFQDNWTANQGLDAARRAMLPTVLLFGDGDQDERRAMWVNSVQFRSGRLSNSDIEALGGPSASGIPLAIPAAKPVVTTVVDGNAPAGLNGTPLTNIVVDEATGTITADLPSSGDQGYLTISPKRTIKSVSVQGGKLVIRY